LNNLAQRIITAIIGGSAVVFLIYWNQYGFAFLFFVLNAVSLWEFYKLSNSNKLSVPTSLAIALGICLFSLGFLTESQLMDSKLFRLALVAPFLIFIVELFRHKEQPFQNIAFSILGWIYITLPFYILTLISFREGFYNFHYVYGVLFLLWASDSFAYFAGRFLGSHKLYEKISPKKTWEGLLGGLLGSFTVAYIISLFFTELTLTNWLVISFLIVTTGTLGDLVESMYKRSLEIKDSGNILPGHGGVLDRFDGFFISIPFVYVYLQFI
jgi:phosphatidate cytidylyltransferase